MPSIVDLAPPWMSFHRAADWGVIWKRPPVAEKQHDPETYIHHGAGGRFGLDALVAMRSLQKWFHETKNYSTIGYDIMVHRNTVTGHVAICGARENWLSAATRDRNELGEAICLMGYFHPGHPLSEQPTAREIEALAFAVAWSMENGWSALDTNVMGHRENPAHPGDTGCPGDYLFPHVPHIGLRAIEIFNLAHNTQETIMTPIKPKRVYDSRTNGGLPFMPGESRGVDLSSASAKPISAAAINVTAVGAGDITNGTANGHISINDPSGKTSVTNYSSDDRVEANSVSPVEVVGGKIIVSNYVGVAHVAIDVFGVQ